MGQFHSGGVGVEFLFAAQPGEPAREESEEGTEALASAAENMPRHLDHKLNVRSDLPLEGFLDSLHVRGHQIQSRQGPLFSILHPHSSVY